MDFRNKKLVRTVLVLFGLFMLFSGVMGFFPMDESTMPAEMVDATNSLKDNGLYYMIKISEVLVGLMLIFNFWPALAAIIIAPIAIGIIVFNAFIAPPFIVAGVVVALLDGYLGYVYWDKFKNLF